MTENRHAAGTDAGGEVHEAVAKEAELRKGRAKWFASSIIGKAAVSEVARRHDGVRSNRQKE